MPVKRPERLKLAPESAVRKAHLSVGKGMQPEPGCARVSIWVRPKGRDVARPRRGVRPVLPGEKPATYPIKGPTTEHGNLDPSAGRAKPRQAAKSRKVSDERRSLRSSRSAGKPRTGRREAGMRATSMPAGKAMYVASEPDRAWLRSKRRELYARSQGWQHPPDFAKHPGEPGA